MICWATWRDTTHSAGGISRTGLTRDRQYGSFGRVWTKDLFPGRMGAVWLSHSGCLPKYMYVRIQTRARRQASRDETCTQTRINDCPVDETSQKPEHYSEWTCLSCVCDALRTTWKSVCQVVGSEEQCDKMSVVYNYADRYWQNKSDRTTIGFESSWGIMTAVKTLFSIIHISNRDLSNARVHR